METQNHANPTAFAPGEKGGQAGSIGIQVVGGDLLLRGRFAQWMPLVIANAPQNDAQATAQILFDVTSHRTEASTKEDPDLFSFRATSVKRVAPQAYKVKGQLRSGGESRQVEAFLQSPAAHTPFFVITFPIEREGFAALWDTLEQRVARPGQTELRPEAWLREPELAAA